MSAGLSAIGRRAGSSPRLPIREITCQTSAPRRCDSSAAWATTVANGWEASIAASASSRGSGSRMRSITAERSESLSGNTRKRVPSAMPAASATWRVVTCSPCSMSSGMAASTMLRRRSSNGSDAARVRAGGAWSSCDAMSPLYE